MRDFKGERRGWGMRKECLLSHLLNTLLPDLVPQGKKPRARSGEQTDLREEVKLYSETEDCARTERRDTHKQPSHLDVNLERFRTRDLYTKRLCFDTLTPHGTRGFAPAPRRLPPLH